MLRHLSLQVTTKIWFWKLDVCHKFFFFLQVCMCWLNLWEWLLYAYIRIFFFKFIMYYNMYVITRIFLFYSILIHLSLLFQCHTIFCLYNFGFLRFFVNIFNPVPPSVSYMIHILAWAQRELKIVCCHVITTPLQNCCHWLPLHPLGSRLLCFVFIFPLPENCMVIATKQPKNRPEEIAQHQYKVSLKSYSTCNL